MARRRGEQVQHEIPDESASEPEPSVEAPAAPVLVPNLPAPQRPSKDPLADPEDEELLVYRRAARKFHPERQWPAFYTECKRGCAAKGLRGVDSRKLTAWMARSGFKVPR